MQNINMDQGRTSGGALAIENEVKLQKVAKQFESMFMNLLLKSMRETVPMSDLIDNQGEIRYYRQMLDEEMSKHMASGSQGLGIATKIIEQFRPHLQDDSPDRNTEKIGVVPVDISAADRVRVEKALAVYDANSGGLQEAAGNTVDLHRRAGAVSEAAADTLQTYETEILNASRRTDLDPELLLAVIMAESAGRADVVSDAGAQGLMQLMPETATELGVDDPLDPSQNIDGGARYLSRLNEKYAGDLDLVLAGYNAGPGNVFRAGNRIPDFPETRNYINKVTELYEALRADPSQ